MDVINAIQTRRAVKQFDPQHRMPQAEIDELISLTMLSPTAFNIQNWRFVLLRDPDLRRDVRAAAWDQAQVTDASLLIILCADFKSWEKQPERYWRNTTPDIQNFIVPAIGNYYRDHAQVQRDEAMRSCGIAAQTLMLAAKAMGDDSCPMDGFDFAAVGKLIKLPQDHVIAMFVAIGKGIREPWPRGGQLPLQAVTISDHF
jgi:nitroreductase